MAMNPNLTSAVSGLSKGRTERSDRPSLRALIQNLITRVRLWLGKLVSFPFVRVLVIFVVGFAAGVVWQSYGGPVRKTIASWSPYLGWLAPPSASASYERIRADLVAARQSLDRLGTDISRLEAQSADVPRRRTAR
jgi:hypothetical protein